VRAHVVTGPGQAVVMQVADPKPTFEDLLIKVERVGICGTDVELFHGKMAYIDQGLTTFPIRLGHEWTGTVIDVGSDVNRAWIGKRVTGDTMLGCGTCSYCVKGSQHSCPNRREIGITDGWPGALAEMLLIPERFALEIPETLSLSAAALVEPGGNSLRCIEAAEVLVGQHILILGAGTIGLLAGQFALARGAIVHIVGDRENALAIARNLGMQFTYNFKEIISSKLGFDSVIDATSLPTSPNLAIKLVRPSGRVVLIGISSSPSVIDTREIVFKDVALTGILSGSPGLKGAIEIFASKKVIPDSIVSEVIGLEAVSSRLLGNRGDNAGPGPKVHVDPRI
jgi:threonine dehydrogenase-like Zn-dependent dehydrogenase